MNSDRRLILSLIASGRITAREAERLIAVANESRETAWILASCVAVTCLAGMHLHGFATDLVHFLNTQIPVLAGALHQALSPITDLTLLMQRGGSL